MDKCSNQQHRKLLPHRSIYSVILGTISVILLWIIALYGLNFVPVLMFVLSFIIAVMLALVGLNIGIKRLRLSEKRIAVSGMVICTASLFFWIYLLFAWLMMGGPNKL